MKLCHPGGWTSSPPSSRENLLQMTGLCHVDKISHHDHTFIKSADNRFVLTALLCIIVAKREAKLSLLSQTTKRGRWETGGLADWAHVGRLPRFQNSYLSLSVSTPSPFFLFLLLSSQVLWWLSFPSVERELIKAGSAVSRHPPSLEPFADTHIWCVFTVVSLSFSSMFVSAWWGPWAPGSLVTHHSKEHSFCLLGQSSVFNSVHCWLTSEACFLLMWNCKMNIYLFIGLC